MVTKFRPEFKKGFQKEFQWFLDYDRATAAKIKILMADILEHPMEGLGRPERLKHRKGKVCSRHIDKNANGEIKKGN